MRKMLCILLSCMIILGTVSVYGGLSAYAANFPVVASVDIYHHHSASCSATRLKCGLTEHQHSAEGGACYTQKTKTTTVNCYHTILSSDDTWHQDCPSCGNGDHPYHGYWYCSPTGTVSNCGATVYNNQWGVAYCLSCWGARGYINGYSTQTPVTRSGNQVYHTVSTQTKYWALTCTKTPHTHTSACYESYYKCGRAENQFETSIRIEKEKSGSTYVLHAVVSGTALTGYNWSSTAGHSGVTSYDITVTGNGTYNFNYSGASGGVPFSGTLSYTVDDYINQYTLSVPNTVTVNANGAFSLDVTYTPVSYSKGNITVTPTIITLNKLDDDTITNVSLPVTGDAVVFSGSTTKTKTYSGRVSLPSQAGTYSGTLSFNIDSGND